MKRLRIILVVIAVLAGSCIGVAGAPVGSALQIGSQESPPSPAKYHMLKDLHRYLAEVQPLLDRYGYAAVFVAVLVEGFGIPAPGQTLLMAGSLAAVKKELRIAWLLLAALAAALLGNSIGYLLGRWGGRAILSKFKVNERRMERIEGLFSRYGGGVIVIARFLDGLRQLNGITAGILEMPWWVFTFYNVLGAVVWTSFWGLGLFYLDENIYLLHRALQHVRAWSAAVAVAVFALLIVYLLRRRNREAGGGT